MTGATPEETTGTRRKNGSEPNDVDGKRWINVALEDHEPDEPIETNGWYTLAFDIDVGQRKESIANTEFAEPGVFKEGVEEVTLTIQLDSEDFEITQRTRPLRVPRSGRSKGKARFDISPRHDGTSPIKATVHMEGNFIQQMELTFEVGATRPTPVGIDAKGRPAAAASMVEPRDVGLSLSPAAGGGYDCVVWGSVSARAKLTIQEAHLAVAIETARQELMKVVMHQDADGNYIFQIGIDIPDVDRDEALRIMARAGSRLFQQLFYGPGAGADSKAIGDFLKRMAADKKTRLKLQILAESTPLPWGLLYVGDASAGAKLDWDNFIGMRHIIEQIPLQPTLSVSDSVIASDQPTLSVSVNVNRDIDRQMGRPFVADQEKYWRDTAKTSRQLRVKSRTTRDELVQALNDVQTDDQILYFYCHAESLPLSAGGGPDKSTLVLSDASVTLGDLSLDAPTSLQLRGNPLVFINACESADLSPLFYDGFVPYFMAKGARGVVGTECKTPALFAEEWAERFFGRFLNGDPLGETFLELRREFLDTHGNPLGLLYAVHCDGDTHVLPGVTIAK
ncbi:MAG: CHAT domain-containing protein [Gemmatimonadaceae bacterium]